MESIQNIIIFILHVIFFIFVISTPFNNSNYLSLLHLIIVPFIMFHWLLNDNTCSIVFMEKKFNKYILHYNDDYRGFFANLIEPVYDFKKNNIEYSSYIYTITATLWLITISKLYIKYRNGEIKSFNDLFIS